MSNLVNKNSTLFSECEILGQIFSVCRVPGFYCRARAQKPGLGLRARARALKFQNPGSISAQLVGLGLLARARALNFQNPGSGAGFEISQITEVGYVFFILNFSFLMSNFNVTFDGHANKY